MKEHSYVLDKLMNKQKERRKLKKMKVPTDSKLVDWREKSLEI